MKVAISQPEHFPYLGYFHKMAACDLFIILDHVQYGGRRSFQNRNCFRNNSGKIEWFTVPIMSGSYFLPINQIKTSADPNWRPKIQRKLFYEFKKDFSEIYEHGSLLDINLSSIYYIRNKLNINVPMILSSGLEINTKKSELLADLCRVVGGSTYLCGPGGKGYLNEAFFKGISVEYVSHNGVDYMSSLCHVNNT